MTACIIRRPAARRKLAVRCVCAYLLLTLLAPVLAGFAALLLPEAPGDTVYKKKGTVVDASHADQGYIMVRHSESNKRLKLRVTLGKTALTYDLNQNGEYEVFPLQLGSGKYKVQVFSQVSGNRYNTVSSISFKVELESGLLPFLYPNQYVNYSADSLAVQRAAELCAGLEDAESKFRAVYQYIVSHMVYDYILAIKVENGYLPTVDTTLQTNKGICFDFAALLATMLRSQGVPTQLVIGYADRSYHAWNLVYIGDQWLRCDTTADICNMSVSAYTTERYY